MAAPTLVRIVLTVNAIGASPAAIATAMDKTRIAADLDTLALLGSTINADTTAAGAGKATRTFDLNLNVPPLLSSFQNNPQLEEFQGSIVSESDQDGPGGTGSLIVSLNYLDAASAPHTEAGIVLNGKTRVNLTNKNHATLVSLVQTTGGPLVNFGRLIIYNGLAPGVVQSKSSPLDNSRNQAVAWLAQPPYRLIIPPALPDATTMTRLFANYMKRKVWTVLGLPVFATAPVFS